MLVKAIGDSILENGKTTPPFVPAAPKCMCPIVAVARVCETEIVNILVVLLKDSVAVPMAVELLLGTSLVPLIIALKFVILGPEFELSLQDVRVNTKSVIPKNRIKFFILIKLRLYNFKGKSKL
jgi:hypothetical protein